MSAQLNTATDEFSAMELAVSWAQSDPVRFARDILQLKRLPGEMLPHEVEYNPDADWELEQWQIELIESVADVYRKRHSMPTKFNHQGKSYVTVRSCRGTGKTFGLALLAHIFGFAFDPVIIPCVAPKLEHLKTRFMAEFTKIATRAIPGYRDLMDIQATTVHWFFSEPVNHMLLCETGRQPENIQGLRRRFTLYLVDESSGIDETMPSVIEGNLASTEIGIRVEVSNPTRNIGHFAQTHLSKRTEQDYHRMHVGPEKSRRVKQVWLDKMVRAYGANSPVVQVHCFGNFADASPRQLITLAWVTDAMDKEPRKPDGSIRRIRVSLDVADGGTDESVVCVKEMYDSYERVLRIRRYVFTAKDAVALAADAAEEQFLELGGVKLEHEIVVDGLGVGAGARDILLRRGYRVVEHIGGASSSEPTRWRNRRVQAYLCLRDALRDGNLEIADDAFDTVDDYEEFLAQ